MIFRGMEVGRTAPEAGCRTYSFRGAQAQLDPTEVVTGRRVAEGTATAVMLDFANGRSASASYQRTEGFKRHQGKRNSCARSDLTS